MPVQGKNSKKRISLLGGIVSLLVLLVVVGCAKPPTQEMADAQAALAAAKAAQADVYVPNEYTSADDLLAKARAKALDEKEKWFKNYDEARKAAIESKKIADAAKENAIIKKAKAKAEAEEIISQLKTAIGEAKAAEAEKYVTSDFNRVNRTLNELEADYAAEKYLDVISKGREAIARAKDLANKSRLAKAEAERIAAEKARREKERLEKERLARLERERLERERLERERLERERLERERRPKTHSVVKGECLWRIAGSEKIYSDPFQWPLIYLANRSQIKDPDLIYPKQEFNINRNASTSEIKQAITTAKTRGPWSLFDGK